MCDRDLLGKAARYRELAEECERLVDLATDESTRAYYRWLAEYYLARARAIEPRNIAPHDIAPHSIEPHNIEPHNIEPHNIEPRTRASAAGGPPTAPSAIMCWPPPTGFVIRRLRPRAA